MERERHDFEAPLTDEEILNLSFAPGHADPSREVIEQINSRYLTEKGVEMWWDRPAWQLEDQTPNQAWQQEKYEDVLHYARGGLDQIAT